MINITAITILTGRGADRIMITTNLPCGTWPYEGFQSFNTEVAAGTGVNYAKENISFVIEPTVINLESGNHSK